VTGHRPSADTSAGGHGSDDSMRDDSMRDDSMLDKVRKLLAKAEATDNPHEAEVFSAKAAELIAAHRLAPDRLVGRGPADMLTLRRLPMGRGAYVRARLALLGAVAGAHDCEIVFETGGSGTVAVLAGFSSDLDATAVLYESLHVQAAAQMASIRRTTPAATQRWRRAFLFGYASRLGELLGEARRVAEADVTAHAGSSRLPDLPARAEQVRRFASESFGRVVKASAPTPAVAGGWEHGQRAAGSADIGRSRLAGRRAIGRGGPS
jgi:hypothetical protein